MKVSELIKMLQDEDQDKEIVFFYIDGEELAFNRKCGVISTQEHDIVALYVSFESK